MNKSEFFEKLIKILKWIMPEMAIIVGALVVDLVSKAIIAATMEYGQTIVLIPKLLNFSYTVNPKAAFGSDFGLSKIFGENGVMIFFIILTIVAVGFFCFLLFKKPKKGMLYRVAFSLVIAGALGNLYDRIFLDGVRDFIQFEYLGLTIFGSTTFAIFNIADACVVVGVILLIVFYLFFDKSFKSDREKAEETVSESSDENITDLKNENDNDAQNEAVLSENALVTQNSISEEEKIQTQKVDIPFEPQEKENTSNEVHAEGYDESQDMPNDTLNADKESNGAFTEKENAEEANVSDENTDKQ